MERAEVGQGQTRVTEPVLHVDMDAFYASVEVIKDPSLKGKPVIVGGQGGRGVVTSASYEARAFGVHSAMPSIRAKRLCPHAIFLRNDFEAYLHYSEKIRDIFYSYTPLVEPLSLDEAFLDVGGSVKIFGPPVEIARRIKTDVAALGLPCTVGVAPNKFLAKLASDAGKPDGLLVVPADAVERFLHPLPVQALWGVGEKTAEALTRLGLKTVGDIAALPPRTLERAVGDNVGAHLWKLSQGIDDRHVTPDESNKQVGSEETFSTDLDDTDEILKEILRLSDRTAGRLRSKDLCARTVTLKVRWANFQTITRSKTCDHEIDTTSEIYATARALFDKIPQDRPRVRLLGVSVSGLSQGPATRQLQLGAVRTKPGWEEASKAIDDIRSRFGKEAVRPATLLEDPGDPTSAR